MSPCSPPAAWVSQFRCQVPERCEAPHRQASLASNTPAGMQGKRRDRRATAPAAQAPLTIRATRNGPGGPPCHGRAGGGIAIFLPRSRSAKAAGKKEPEGAGRGRPRGSLERRAAWLREVKNLSFLWTGGQREKDNPLTIFTKKFPRAFFLLMFLSIPFGSLEVVRGLVSLIALESEGSLTELVLSLARNFQTGKGFLTSY